MKTMGYFEILNVLGISIGEGITDFEFTGVSTDTRTISAGDLFIALNGENFRGSDFADVAVRKGARAIVSSDDISVDVPVIHVDDTLAAYQELAAHYREKFNIPVIAVTGSNGKTTTKNMIYTILSSRYHVLASDKNYNNGIGLPRTVFMLDESHQFAVLEMGMNHLGEIDRLTRIAKPSVAVITNVGKAHIGLLGSQENIKKAKLEIVNGLVENGILILNGDDAYLSDVRGDHFRVSYVGIEHNGDLLAKDIRVDNTKIVFTVCNGNESSECILPAIGIHNVYNALEAINCCIQFGFSLSDACYALSLYESSPMRNEIAFDKGVIIIKDYYNSSPESVSAAIDNLVRYKTSGRRIAVLGQMHELGQYSGVEHERIARLCHEKKLDHVFFIGNDCESFKLGIGNTPCDCFMANERQKLQESLLSYVNLKHLRARDIVLIKGSRATKMEEIYENLKVYINAYKSDYVALSPSPTKLYVDVGAIKFNYLQLRNSLEKGVEIMPMVKANAYGCGSDIIANVFKDCKYLAVADIKEASLIRRLLPESNIMIIYQPVHDDIDEIVKGNYISAVSDISFAKELNEKARDNNVKCRIHIEVDTGAGRLGISVSGSKQFATEISDLKNLSVEGIFMHYVCADSFADEDLVFTKLQTERFQSAVSDIESILGTVKYKHACAGAAIFNRNAAHYNMVRPGYMLYGYYPSDELKSMIDLKPALKFVSVILKITDYDEGTPISYNRRFVTNRKSRIATVAVGYSDGIYRKLYHPENLKNGCFVVNGQRAPIVGSICMDLTMIDITDIEGEVNVGDEVAVFDNVNVTVDEMADICETIGYEIIARIEDKADRIEAF